MTEAVKQAAVQAFPAKQGGKHAKHVDATGFGDALRSAGKSKAQKDENDAAPLRWEKHAAKLDVAGAMRAKAEKAEAVGETVVDLLKLKVGLDEERDTDVLAGDDELDAPDSDEPEESKNPGIAAGLVDIQAVLRLLRPDHSDAEGETAQASVEDARGKPALGRAQAEAAGEAKSKTAASATERTSDQAHATDAPPVDAKQGAPRANALPNDIHVEVQARVTTAAPLQAAAAVVAKVSVASPADDADTVAATAIQDTDAQTMRVTSPDAPSRGAAQDKVAARPEAVTKAVPANDKPIVLQNPSEPVDESAPEVRRAEPAAAHAKSGSVEFVGSTQAAPAPGTNANAIVAAISSDPTLRPSVETMTQQITRLSTSGGSQVHSLKIQLHPAELGMVTAQLSFAGDQLSVELQVENAEAYNRLTLDMETISKSLRSLGFDIDQVTIQQSQTVVAASARADVSSNSGGGFQRDASAFTPGNSSNGEGRTGGQATGKGQENGSNRQSSGPAAGQRGAGSGLYI